MAAGSVLWMGRRHIPGSSVMHPLRPVSLHQTDYRSFPALGRGSLYAPSNSQIGYTQTR